MSFLPQLKVFFIGSGAGGKTSLLRSVMGEEFDPFSIKTELRDYREYSIQVAGNDFIVHITDLEGQHIPFPDLYEEGKIVLRRETQYALGEDIQGVANIFAINNRSFEESFKIAEHVLNYKKEKDEFVDLTPLFREPEPVKKEISEESVESKDVKPDTPAVKSRVIRQLPKTFDIRGESSIGESNVKKSEVKDDKVVSVKRKDESRIDPFVGFLAEYLKRSVVYANICGNKMKINMPPPVVFLGNKCDLFMYDDSDYGLIKLRDDGLDHEKPPFRVDYDTIRNSIRKYNNWISENRVYKWESEDRNPIVSNFTPADYVETSAKFEINTHASLALIAHKAYISSKWVSLFVSYVENLGEESPPRDVRNFIYIKDEGARKKTFDLFCEYVEAREAYINFLNEVGLVSGESSDFHDFIDDLQSGFRQIIDTEIDEDKLGLTVYSLNNLREGVEKTVKQLKSDISDEIKSCLEGQKEIDKLHSSIYPSFEKSLYFNPINPKSRRNILSDLERNILSTIGTDQETDGKAKFVKVHNHTTKNLYLNLYKVLKKKIIEYDEIISDYDKSRDSLKEELLKNIKSYVMEKYDKYIAEAPTFLDKQKIESSFEDFIQDLGVNVINTFIYSKWSYDGTTRVERYSSVLKPLKEEEKEVEEKVKDFRCNYFDFSEDECEEKEKEVEQDVKRYNLHKRDFEDTKKMLWAGTKLMPPWLKQRYLDPDANYYVCGLIPRDPNFKNFVELTSEYREFINKLSVA